MLANDLPITGPCPIDLDAIGFDRSAKVSHCTHCAKNVTNLSNMTRDEARGFMREHKGERLCVSYACDQDGNIRFRSAPEPALVPVTRLRPRRSAGPGAQPAVALASARRGTRAGGFVAALGVSAVLAACAPHGEPPRDVIVEGKMEVPHERGIDRQADPIPTAGAAVIPREVMVDGEMAVPDPGVIDEPCDRSKDVPGRELDEPAKGDRDARRSRSKERAAELPPEAMRAGGLMVPDVDALEASNPPRRRS